MLFKKRLIQQILKKKKYRRKILQYNPHKKGTCLKVYVTTPKKPNSAIRKVTKIVLTNKKTVICQIPGKTNAVAGSGLPLQKHSTVLIKGSRVRDLPGIKYRAIRGKFDLKAVLSMRRGRSKYGTKRIL